MLLFYFYVLSFCFQSLSLFLLFFMSFFAFSLWFRGLYRRRVSIFKTDVTQFSNAIINVHFWPNCSWTLEMRKSKLLHPLAFIIIIIDSESFYKTTTPPTGHPPALFRIFLASASKHVHASVSFVVTIRWRCYEDSSWSCFSSFV